MKEEVIELENKNTIKAPNKDIKIEKIIEDVKPELVSFLSPSAIDLPHTTCDPVQIMLLNAVNISITGAE